MCAPTYPGARWGLGGSRAAAGVPDRDAGMRPRRVEGGGVAASLRVVASWKAWGS